MSADLLVSALLVSALPGEIRAAVLRDGVLQDLLILRDTAPVQVGDRFLAKVGRFDKGLEGAFVDLGLERDGLLPAREVAGPMPPEGSALPVAVIRAPAADKGARVSAKRAGASLDDAQGLRAPARLGGGQGVLTDLMRRAEVSTVVCDDADLLRRLRAAVGEEDCAFDLAAPTTSLFQVHGVEAEIDALLQPVVTCPGGAALLIEPVQTLTAIDVNSARHDGRGGAQAQARAVNLAAVPEIARQLRLRALSGLIVVDFLALKKPEDRKAVAAALRRAVADDPEPCQVFGLSPSGLLEMTRRRGRAPLHEVLCRPCGIGGRGWEKSPETLAYEALRHLAAAARGHPPNRVTLKVAPAVAAALQDGQAAALKAVEERLGGPIALVADPLVAHFDLVLD
ncbi:ribonuclease E/G [Pelagibius sp.]|uniref:ribonuclease E/G n=1 Tax=Pelagibius sp. TaxID=1931238 RepID=UPI00262735CE|nr:ribonuclease E/G [Pelagibius sp.]